MKRNQLKEVRSKNTEELKKDLDEAKRNLAKTKLELLSGKNKNMRAGSLLRKNIAQISTILNEKTEAEKS